MNYVTLSIRIAKRRRKITIHPDLIKLTLLKIEIDPSRSDAEERICSFLERFFGNFDFDKGGNNNKNRYNYMINRLLMISLMEKDLVKEFLDYEKKQEDNLTEKT